ncbi:MAG: UMP kinase [Bacteroidales bacterium]|nr:UMP kinase [Lentimicrobiaceae bacterium]MDD5694318.1 UMP kinase [Bacteroidales bacterium]
MKYRRILLKLSGESLQGNQSEIIDSERLGLFAREIKSVAEKGVQVAIVIGGGNIFRGLKGTGQGIHRVQGDYMGMLATLINSLALQEALEDIHIRACVFSALKIESVAEKITSRRAIQALENGQVVILAGGTGNPFFTTDSAAVLRALEIGADVILKGTRVEGIYSADPEKNPDATKYTVITFDEALQKGLKIMDLTAFTLCKDNHLPLIVFNFNVPGNLLRVLMGENVGTLVNI